MINHLSFFSFQFILYPFLADLELISRESRGLSHSKLFESKSMNLEKQSSEVQSLTKKILASEYEPVYKKIEKQYISDFCKENGLEEDFTISSLLMPDGTLSGLGHCSACVDKLKKKSKF